MIQKADRYDNLLPLLIKAVSRMESNRNPLYTSSTPQVWRN